MGRPRATVKLKVVCFSSTKTGKQHFFSSGWGRRKHCTRRQSDAPARLPLPFLSIIVILHLLTIIRNYPARKKTIISPKSSQTNPTLQKVGLRYSTDQSQTTIINQIGQVSAFRVGWGILCSGISKKLQYPLYIYGTIKHKWDGTGLRWRFNLFTIRKNITI